MAGTHLGLHFLRLSCPEMQCSRHPRCPAASRSAQMCAASLLLALPHPTMLSQQSYVTSQSRGFRPHFPLSSSTLNLPFACLLHLNPLRSAFLATTPVSTTNLIWSSRHALSSLTVSPSLFCPFLCSRCSHHSQLGALDLQERTNLMKKSE